MFTILWFIIHEFMYFHENTLDDTACSWIVRSSKLESKHKCCTSTDCKVSSGRQSSINIVLNKKHLFAANFLLNIYPRHYRILIQWICPDQGWFYTFHPFLSRLYVVKFNQKSEKQNLNGQWKVVIFVMYLAITLRVMSFGLICSISLDELGIWNQDAISWSLVARKAKAVALIAPVVVTQGLIWLFSIT